MTNTRQQSNKFTTGPLIIFVAVGTAAMFVNGLFFGGLGQLGWLPGCTVGLEEFCSELYMPILGGIGFVLSLILGLTLKRGPAIVTLAVVVVAIFLASAILPMIFYQGPPVAPIYTQ